MKLLIDSLSSITDWNINSPSTIEAISVKQFIAGLNDSSLFIKFDSSDSVKVAYKTISPIDVTEYETLVFSIWSQEFKANGRRYTKSDQFNYKLKINDNDEFYLRIFDSFSDISIGIESITSINRIEITALHDETDYLIISEMVVEKEEMEYDILSSIKETIEYFLNNEFGNGILLGNTSVYAGDNSIPLPNFKWLDNYSVVKIDDTINNELHQLSDNDEENFSLNDNLDGKLILNDFSNAPVYLTFPVTLYPSERDIKLPGISLWGMDPDPILRGAKLDTELDTFSVNNDNFKSRKEGEIYNYIVLIDIEARQYELLYRLAKIIRKFISKESLWINGRRHDVWFQSQPTEFFPTQGIDIIPKIQYKIEVEFKESINERETLPKTITQNLDIVIGGQ